MTKSNILFSLAALAISSSLFWHWTQRSDDKKPEFTRAAARAPGVSVRHSPSVQADARLDRASTLPPDGNDARNEAEMDLGTPAARAMRMAIERAIEEKRQRAPLTGPLSKLDESLDELRTRVASAAKSRLTALGELSDRSLLRLHDLSVPGLSRVAADGAIHVYVHTKSALPLDAEALKAAGLRVELIQSDMRVVQGWLPYDRFEAVGALETVTSITLPEYAVRRQGSVMTQGDVLLKANLVRQMVVPGPYTGTGIKVGIISDGVSSRAIAIASGDVPSGVTVHPTLQGSGDEGTAMWEIVHDLAPGAQLYFAGPETSAEMVTAIQWLVSQGCHVICDDLGFFDQPFFADGAIAVAARDAVVTSGRVYVTAAGNDALKHYQGLFVASGLTFGGKPSHDFKAGAGVDDVLDINVPPGRTVIVDLQWDDAFGAAGNDYDLYLVDSSFSTFLAQGVRVQNGDDNPTERVSWTNTGATTVSVYAAVNLYSGVPKTLELFVRGGFAADDDFSTADSVFGHPAVSEVISCAAINADTPGLATIASSSSRGPSTIAFPSAQIRPTPMITGVDGVSVTGAGGFPNPFFGTSAAAPHVAAICALMLDRYPLATPAQIRAALSAAAVDKGTGGYDNTYGYGLVDALAAVTNVQVPQATFAVAALNVAENAGTFVVTTNLSIPAGETVTLPFTVGGSATAADFSLSASAITIAAGASSGSITVTVIDNLVHESNETVVLTMGTPGNATLGSITSFTATILDNDPAATAPTIGDIANQTVNEDVATSPLEFAVSDAETAAGSLTVTGSSSNTTLVPSANIVFGGSGANRTVTVTPAANQSGTATITVTVSDGTLTASDTFVLTVNAVNDAPTIGDIANQSVNEDAATGALAFNVGDVETAAGSLTVSGSSSNTTLVPIANIVFGGNGASRTVAMTPAANQSGTATITVTVSDGGLTASDTFVLTVNEVNDAPTIRDIANQTILTGTNTGPLPFTIGDVETAAGSLTVSGSSSNTTLVPNANIVFGGSGANRTVTVTPAASQNGSTTITVTVSDGALTASDTFSVIVQANAGVATHAVVGGGYIPGSTVTIANTLTYTGTATALGWQVLLPAGWSYASDGGTAGNTRPVVGQTDMIEWAWTTIPANPVAFSYTLNVPSGQTGDKQIAALMILRQGGDPQQFLAQPDPLVVSQVTTHSADTDRSFRISLLELTRVIELYNTRNGTTRTGCYAVPTSTTEDGFAPEPIRSSGAVITLTKYHSADSNRDGKLGLLELTRVIELYNYRSGTTRTGQYHAQAGTEDGFAPGP